MTPNKIHSICRVCMIENGEINIFNNQLNENSLIYTLIMMLTSLEISEEDELPNNICCDCLEELKTAIAFIRKCEISDKQLRSTLKNITNRDSINKDALEKQNSYIKDNGAKQLCIKKDNHPYINLNQYSEPVIIKIESNEQSMEYNCKLCLNTFSSSLELTKHKKKHKEVKSFQCHVCCKIFRQNSHLQRHLLIHTGVKPFSCEICHKSFKQKPHLTRHISLHTGFKPFQCEVCGKKFVTPSDLNKHLVIHTGTRPFQCEICGKSYNNTSDLNKHRARKHDNSFTRFMCQICKMRYDTKKSLNQHMLVHCDSDNISIKLSNDKK